MANELIFRVSFYNQETLYEIYANKVCESNMMGFIEIEEFVFGETTSLVVDPSEERLKNEFSEVKRTYIPMHSILRIDEVSKQGISKAREFKPGSKVTSFPTSSIYQQKDDN